MLERVSLLLRLNKASNTPREPITAALIVISSIIIIYKLPSLNCGHYLVNPNRFSVDIAHFVVVNETRLACFGAEVLWCGRSVNLQNMFLEFHIASLLQIPNCQTLK
jgi:hypothetical protein